MSALNHQAFLNSPKQREKRIKTRQIAQGKVTNPYYQELKERAEFRNKMRHELKQAAKLSFAEELDELRRTNRLVSNIDKDRQEQLEMEVEKLKTMLFDLKGQHEVDPLETHWNTMRDSPYQNIPDSFDLNNNSVASSVFPFSRSNVATSVQQQRGMMPPQNKNGLFVLSCAPVNNFEDVIANEFASSTTKQGLTIPQQVQQYNELQSLFALPSYADEFTHVYSMRQQQLQSQSQVQQESFEQIEAKENKVRANIDKHRGRLQYSREKRIDIYSPRTPAPSTRGRSRKSPRVRTSRNQSPGRSLSPASSKKSHSAPGAARSEHHFPHMDDDASVGDRLEGGRSAAMSANNSLKQIVRESMNEYLEERQLLRDEEAAAAAAAGVTAGAEENRGRSPSRSPANHSRTASPAASLKVQDLTLEEFQQLADKMQNDIKTLIEETVKEEIKADAKTRKFTKRHEAAALAKQSQPLAKKIEDKVGDKISALQAELERLRGSRLHGRDSVPSDRPNMIVNVGNRGGALLLQGGDDAAFDDGPTSRVREEPNWFANNELSRSRDRVELDNSPNRNRSGSGANGRDMYRQRLPDPNDLAQVSQLTDAFGSVTEESPSARPKANSRRNSTVNKYTVGLGLGDLMRPPSPRQGRPPSPGSNAGPGNRSRTGSSAVADPRDPRADPRYNDEMTMQQNRIEAQLLQAQQQAQQAAYYAQQQELQKQAQANRLEAHKVQNQQLAKQQALMQERQQMIFAQTAPGSVVPALTAAPTPVAPAAPAPIAAGRRGGAPPTIDPTAPPLQTPAANKANSVAFATPAAAASSSAGAGQFDLSPTPAVKGPAPSVAKPPAQAPPSSLKVANAAVEAEIKSLEVEYRGLMSSLLNLVELKTNIKKELKDWNTTFEKENGRPAMDADKAKINDRFLAYKMVSTQVQETKASVKAVEEKTKKLKDSL